MRTALWWLAAAVLLGGYLAVRQYYGGAGTLAREYLAQGRGVGVVLWTTGEGRTEEVRK